MTCGFESLRRRFLAKASRLGAALAFAGLLISATAAPPGEPVTDGGQPSFRRLNEAQYRRSIADIFGAGIEIPGRFEPALRQGGLLAIGDANVAISASGFEQYELRARQIAAKVLDADRRVRVVPCTPSSPQLFDRTCATTFITRYGRLLYRRPLDRQELASILAISGDAARRSGNFYKGLEIALLRMLASPNFIFRIETGAGQSGRLESYSLASRLSFFLWDAPPDPELLDAAASGALATNDGLVRQTDRMIASPRFADGTRAFFSDMLGYEAFGGLSKDQSIYPKFTSQLAKDAQEQALRTIVDLLVTHKGDYRDLFTTRKTFINRNLGALYRVQVSTAAVDGWQPYTFASDDPRAGLLTMAAFLMLDPSHEGRSSPTIRGKTVREQLLCQEVPSPPPNVNFSIVQNTDDPQFKTARQRLSAHQNDPVCAGCHRITDPIGLSMENYDAIGQYRITENGATIDASGEFEGKSYRQVLELSAYLHDSPDAPSCIVQRAFEYGAGRQAGAGDDQWLAYSSQRFAEDKYQFPALMRTIASSVAFRALAASQPQPGRPAKVSTSR